MGRLIQQDRMIEGLQTFLRGIDLGVVHEITISASRMEVTLEVFVRQRNGRLLYDADNNPVTTFVTYPYGSREEDVLPATSTEDE